MVEAVEHLVVASHPAEAFESLSARLLEWLSCEAVALQVPTLSAEPILFQRGASLDLPGIGVGWRCDGTSSVRSLLSAEYRVHDDLARTFALGEDAWLVRAGFRSAVRVVLLIGGREAGRFGAFAEDRGHFTPSRLRMLRELAPVLTWFCRQVAVAEQMRAESEIGDCLDEVILASPQGLRAALKTCRIHLSRMIPAAGTLVVLEAPSGHSAALVERAGIAVPGAPATHEPAAWRRWLSQIPPEGHIESVAWIFPIVRKGTAVGALAFAFPQTPDSPAHWQRRLQPLCDLLVRMVEADEAMNLTHLNARQQIAALALGLADEIGNLMTELAFQIDLLPPLPEARAEALRRLVGKGTDLSTRLEELALSQGQPEERLPVRKVVRRLSRQLRTYHGGKYVSLRNRLGDVADEIVEAGAVEHLLTQLILAQMRRRTSAVQFGLYGRRSPADQASLTLWLSEEGNHSGQAGAGEHNGPVSVLEVPVFTRSEPMEGSFDGESTEPGRN